MFEKLVAHLIEQIDEQPVEIVAYWNNGEKTIGEIRQALLEAAVGDYVCFVDDDDWVPSYYIAEIMSHLGADYVGFRVNFYNNSYLRKPVEHSLKHTKWYETEEFYYRGVTHLNPLRRELALKDSFRGVTGEDVDWAARVAPFVKTEKFINKVMYHYYHDTETTHFGGDTERVIESRPTYTRPDIKHKAFRYIKETS